MSEEKTTKVNITSTAIEKGIDLAKGFLDKLIMPALEESGLLIKDHVTLWRFNNQVKMLVRAKEYCEKHNIQPKAISMKLLVPLLENASLEEDTFLQDKWAILLANLVDSEQNIENHVFPYLLGQISVQEYKVIENAWRLKLKRIENLNIEIDKLVALRPEIEKESHNKINEINNKTPISPNDRHELWKLENAIKEHDKKILEYKTQILDLVTIDYSELQEFEISNLIRLGVIKLIIEHSAFAEPIVLDNYIRYDPEPTYINIDVGITSDGENYFLTELGELFVKACSEKNTK